MLDCLTVWQCYFLFQWIRWEYFWPEYRKSLLFFDKKLLSIDFSQISIKYFLQINLRSGYHLQLLIEFFLFFIQLLHNPFHHIRVQISITLIPLLALNIDSLQFGKPFIVELSVMIAMQLLSELHLLFQHILNLPLFILQLKYSGFYALLVVGLVFLVNIVGIYITYVLKSRVFQLYFIIFMLFYSFVILALLLSTVLDQALFKLSLLLKPILSDFSLHLTIAQLLEVLRLFILIAAHSPLSNRLLITLLVDYIQTLLFLIIHNFAQNDAWVLRDLVELVLLERWQLLLELESICDLVLHIDGVVGVALLLFQIYVVDLAVSVHVRFPLGIEFFEQCLPGQFVVINAQFFGLFDDFLLGGLFVPVDLL